jgi:hypothetical protein
MHREKGYRFFFSREESRKHVHIVSNDGEENFWLEPELGLARNYRYSRENLKEIESLIEDHYHELISPWRQHFNG